MSVTQTRRLNAVCYLSMAALGMYISAYQYALADITERFSLYAWASGLLISCHFAASFFMPPLVGELSDRIGRKPVLIGLFALMLGGILCVASTRSVAFIALGAIVTGGASCTIESSMSSLLAQENPDNESRVMNLSQMFFCGGACFSPLYGALLSHIGLDWRAIYVTVAALVVVCAVITACSVLPKARPRVKGLYLGRVLKRPFYLLMFAAMLLYVGIEESAAFWTGTFAADVNINASWLLALYWLGMALGRLGAAYLKRHVGKLTLVGLAISALCFGATLFVKTPLLLMACFFLAGLTLAPTWPQIMVHAAKVGADVPDTAAGGMLAAGAAGGMSIPLLLAFTKTAVGMRAAFGVLAGLVCLEALLLASSKRFRQS